MMSKIWTNGDTITAESHYFEAQGTEILIWAKHITYQKV